MERLKRYKKLIMESVFVVGLVCIAAFSEQTVSREEVLVPLATESEPLTQVAEETETVKESPVLSEKQVELLKEIEQLLEEGNLEAAAKILNERDTQFVSLFYTTMEGKDYLCQNGTITDTIEGKGLVFQKPGTLFYGTFQDGFPEGELTALQAINLGAPRYDYSIGTWRNGYMEGEGTIGYRYYEETEENIPREVKKEGNFTEDLMNGPIVYTSVGQNGEPLVWNIEAAAGVTVFLENWSYNEAEDVYQLMAESDSAEAYTIKKSESQSIHWLNLIPWAR